MYEICKMNVLVVAATELEIEPFLATNKHAEILITGIGAPATMFHLTKKLTDNKFDLVIQAGIAGAFANSLALGSVVIIKRDAFADLGIYEKEKFYTLPDAGFSDKNEFPFEDGWLVNKSVSFDDLRLSLTDSITVNTVTDDKKRIELLHKKFNASAESMEGAAFHYVCLQFQTKFLQLRSISNIVGERDKKNWKMKEAIKNLNDELIKIVEHFK